MTTLDSRFHAVQASVTNLVVPLQRGTPVSKDAMDRLEQDVVLLAEALAGSETLQRVMLNELYTVIQVLRREAPYAPSLPAEYPDRLEYLFALILLGEAPSHRQPGVPRIL